MIQVYVHSETFIATLCKMTTYYLESKWDNSGLVGFWTNFVDTVYYLDLPQLTSTQVWFFWTNPVHTINLF